MALSRARGRLLRRIGVRKGREAEAAVLLEGPRVVETVRSLGGELLFAAVEAELRSEGVGELAATLREEGVEVAEVPSQELGELVHTEAPQGILAVAREPRAPLPEKGGTPERCLVLDGVGDPGNVGTLVRSAAAFGVDRILFLDGTADPWGAKAVRASAGFAFALPLHRVAWEEAQRWLEGNALPLLVADGAGEDVRGHLRPETDGALGNADAGWALVVGNEARGSRASVREAAWLTLRVPLDPRVESLNASVAGSVLLWALGPGRGEPAETR